MTSEDIRTISWWWVDKSGSERVILWLDFIGHQPLVVAPRHPSQYHFPTAGASLRHVRASLQNTTGVTGQYTCFDWVQAPYLPAVEPVAITDVAYLQTLKLQTGHGTPRKQATEASERTWRGAGERGA